jgi:hypothetical protein
MSIFDKYKPTEFDFVQDFAKENGNYDNVCDKCASHFIGHKRRIFCKKCQDGIDLTKLQNRLNVTMEPLRIALEGEIIVKVSRIDEIIKYIQSGVCSLRNIEIMVQDLKKVSK